MARKLSLFFVVLMSVAAFSVLTGCGVNDSSTGSGSLAGTWIGQEYIATIDGTNTSYAVSSIRLDITQDSAVVSGVRRVDGITSSDFTGTYNEVSLELTTTYALPGGGQAIAVYKVSAAADKLTIISLTLNGVLKYPSGVLVKE